MHRLFDLLSRASPDADFAPCQVWEYQTRPNESSSTLVIGDVTESNKGRVICVMVQNLQIENTQGEVLTTIAHLPLSERALRASVLRLRRRKQELPESYFEGLRQWRKLFALNKAGFYDISVAECVTVAEQSFNSELRPQV